MTAAFTAQAVLQRLPVEIVTAAVISRENQCLARLQVIKQTWARLLRIQVPMPHNEGLGVLLVKLLQQISQSDTLGFRPCIHRLSVYGKTANVAHANGMSVMVSAMSPDLFFGPACFDGAVCRESRSGIHSLSSPTNDGNGRYPPCGGHCPPYWRNSVR